MDRASQEPPKTNECGSKLKLYKEIKTEEEREVFRQWARDNYTPFDPIDGLWHWIVQEECTRMNREAELPWEHPWDQEGNPL